MKIATYDNLNSHIAKHNDFVDYSSQNETKTQKTTNHLAKRKKAKNKLNFSAFCVFREEAMSELDKILAYNESFVDAEQYAAYQTTKYPERKLAILSCMDTRIVELIYG